MGEKPNSTAILNSTAISNGKGAMPVTLKRMAQQKRVLPKPAR
jgi:hypothetical protein